MNFDKWQGKCNLAKLKVVGRADIVGFVVFVADGYSNGCAELEAPHYRTIYAIGPSPEKLTLMQRIYHPFGDHLGKNKLQDVRVQDAFEQAKAVIERLKDGNIFQA